MSDFISEQIDEYDVIISPNLLDNNLNLHLLTILKEKYENKCSDYGFILKDSIQFISKSLGTIQYHDNNSVVYYKVKCKLKVINPVVDDEINCVINNVTKAGIISYINKLNIKNETITIDGIEESPIVCIVPTTRIENINEYNPKQKIKVKITAIRKKYNANNIQVVGSII
jgi:DNA-directed RNA polymerase subunit E'/Rpb7